MKGSDSTIVKLTIMYTQVIVESGEVEGATKEENRRLDFSTKNTHPRRITRQLLLSKNSITRVVPLCLSPNG